MVSLRTANLLACFSDHALLMRMRSALLIFVASIVLVRPSAGANIAMWSQTSPDFRPNGEPPKGRSAWAVWPPEVARNLRFHIAFDCSEPMRPVLESVFRHACQAWESAADVRFVAVPEKEAANLHVLIKHDGRTGFVYHGGGGSSPPRRDAQGELLPAEVQIGYTGDYNKDQDWRDDCWVWVAAHELGHALGFWHEFQRSDRDRHLRVDPDEESLPRIPHEIGDNGGSAFDYASIMMYAWTDGDRDGRFFLVEPETGEPLGTVNYYQRNGLSPGDVAAIQSMYGPPREPALPVVHVPRRETNGPLQRLRETGWTIIAHPGARIYGVGDAVVFEAEKGLWDHWTMGGNPPRVRRAIDGAAFQFEVELDARHVPPGAFAGLFIVLGPRDWVSFGAWEHPRTVAFQRTGENVAGVHRLNAQRCRLIATFAQGSLNLACEEDGKKHEVAVLEGIPQPVEVGFGTRSWPGAEFAYRRVGFAAVSYRRIDPP